MQAIRQLYKIGYGPSSSHTIAPYRIAGYYRHAYPECTSYEVVLGGSLALTAKGHGTIEILKKALETENIDIRYDFDCRDNVMNILGKDENREYPLWHGLSLGGGAVSIEEYDCGDQKEVYPENSFEEIKKTLKDKDMTLIEYIYSHETDLKDHLRECLKVMYETVNNGLNRDGLLNQELNYYRIAGKLYQKARTDQDYLTAYSYAACEENAAGGLMCTAPTLGACGILTSLMYFLHFNKNVDEDMLCDMLAIAGIFGNCLDRRFDRRMSGRNRRRLFHGCRRYFLLQPRGAENH